MNILILENDHSIAEFIAEALCDEGYQPFVVYTVSSAIALLQAVQPRLILLDLHIPTIEESNLFLEYCRTSAAHAIPIIVVTASVHVQSAEIPGVVGLLRKPFELNELFSCIRQYVDPQPLDGNLHPSIS